MLDPQTVRFVLILLNCEVSMNYEEIAVRRVNTFMKNIVLIGAMILTSLAGTALAACDCSRFLPCFDDGSAAGSACFGIYNDCVASCNRGAAEAPGVWGAIAVSDSTLAYGSAWAYQSEQDAKNRASRECSLAMNAMRDCRVVGTFRNACVALATSPKEHAWGFSGAQSSIKSAVKSAITQCQKYGGRSCTIASQFCSP